MQKRRTEVTLETLSGLLLALPTEEAGSQSSQSAIAATHAVWKGKVAVGNAVTLANHAMQLLRWRFLGSLGLKVAVPVLVFLCRLVSISMAPAGLIPNEQDRQGMGCHRPAYHGSQAVCDGNTCQRPKLQRHRAEALNDIFPPSKRLMDELKPLIAPPDERQRAEAFFMAEFDAVLKLDHAEKTELSSYVHEHLAQGATFHDAYCTSRQKDADRNR